MSHPISYATADAVVVRSGIVLMIQRGKAPFKGLWALPGGHGAPDETLLQTAARELIEETGIAVPVGRMKFVGLYDKPGRDPRGWYISAAYMVVLSDEDAMEAVAADDAADARWFSWDELRTMDLAFDHTDILRDAFQLFKETLA